MAPYSEFMTFLFVTDLEASHSFYCEKLGLELAVDQGDCRIYRVTDTAFLGVCERPDRVNEEGLIVTLVTDDVDAMHQRLMAAGADVETEPEHSEKYGIRHAFYRDPDRHLIEIQSFDDSSWMLPN